jgi:histidinol dehydrogenase
MIKTYHYPSASAEKRITAITNRGLSHKQKDLQTVSRILEDVRKNGDEALIQYVNRFDAPDMTLSALAVTESEMAAAAKIVEPAFTRSLNRAASQIESFHRRQVRQSFIQTDRPGTLLGQLIRPVDAAGVYVPGGKSGKTPLVSSVLMGGIPAKIAGVPRVVMVTPPMADGTVSPYLLAAARSVGIDAVYKIGSAWAIAALAYGTKTVPKVDVIVGPGNIYVTLAKKMVSGTVGIDMIAGPSEILVIADKTANPAFAAADLLSQAEHDPLASAILVTDSKKMASAVAKEVDRQLAELHRRDIAEASLVGFGAIFVVQNMTEADELANKIAPEHLELLVESPFDHVGSLRHAGAIFMGPYTPEPVGDYMAGPNHVLPTAGTARFASALSVDNFIKKTSLIHYNRQAFFDQADDIIRLAETEGLSAHARSVRVRLEAEKE